MFVKTRGRPLFYDQIYWLITVYVCINYVYELSGPYFPEGNSILIHCIYF